MPLVMIKSDPRARLKPCLRCGYSLRNVPDARLCPECGLPIWLTLGGNDDLEMSNPQWLARLAMATLVLAAAHVILLAGVACFHVWRLLANDPWLRFPDAMQVMPFVGAAYFAACGAGLLLLGGDEGRVPERVRGLRRTTMVAGALAIAMAAWLAAPVYDFGPPLLLVLLVAHGQAIAAWAYLRQLARRIPSRRLQQFAKFLSIAVAVAFASVILRRSTWVMWMLFSPWSKRVIAWTLFLLIYPPIAIAMFLYLARTFHAASQAATKNWEPEATSP